MASKIIQQWLKSTYRHKDCDLSVTDIISPDAQLWAKVHTPPKDPNDVSYVSFKSFLGSALHNAIEHVDEDGVVKEFSWVRTLPDGTRIGGTADELRWRYSIKQWRLGDVKLKGDYPTKKFLGVGTKKEPNPKPEQDKEQLQLSIYRWLFDGLFDIEDKAVIYRFTPDHSKWSNYPEYDEVFLELLPINFVEKYIKSKLLVVASDTQPAKDCPEWMCNYCDYQDACTYIHTEHKPNEGFVNEKS